MKREVESVKKRVFGYLLGLLIVMFFVLLVFGTRSLSAEEVEYSPSYEPTHFDLPRGSWEIDYDSTEDELFLESEFSYEIRNNAIWYDFKGELDFSDFDRGEIEFTKYLSTRGTEELVFSDGYNYILGSDIPDETNRFEIRLFFDGNYSGMSEVEPFMEDYRDHMNSKDYDGYFMDNMMGFTLTDMNNDYADKVNQWDSVLQQEIDNAYNDGLDDSTEADYQEGYDEGHSDGYNEGISVDFDGSGFYSALASGMSSILAIEILPNMSIAFIVAISFGFGVLAFFMKQGRK